MPSMVAFLESPHSLKPHPVNGRVYGEAELPEEFLNSVQKLGIIEPIVVRSDNTIISGHRRWAAALKLELKTVPVRTVTFDDELDEIETLIESNRQRVKTVSQIAREGAELQRIEGERAALRRRATQNNETAKAVETNLSKQGSTDEHVAEALGVSMTQWKKLKTIFARAVSGDAEAKELMKALDAGDISVHKAYQKVRDQLSEEQSQHDTERKELIAELNAAKQELKAGAAPKVVEKVVEKPVVREVIREVVPEAMQARLKDLEAQVRKTNANEQYLRNLEDRKVKLQNEIMTLKEQATRDRIEATFEKTVTFIQTEKFLASQMLEFAERGELTIEQVDQVEGILGNVLAETNNALIALRRIRGEFRQGGGLRAL